MVSADQTNKDGKELQNKIQIAFSKIGKILTFSTIEIGQLLEKNPEILQNESLGPYKHFLEKILRAHRHKLSETEEKLIIEKNQYGITEWSKLRAQWLATSKFTMNIGEKEEIVSWSSGYKYFFSPEKKLRFEAVKKILGGIQKDEELYASALRSICGNFVLEAERRRYSVLESSCISNDITQKMLENMFSAIESKIPLFQEFLSYKANLFGQEILAGEDLEAPVNFSNGKGNISWEQAKSMVLKSYSNFDQEFGDIVSDMFNKNRIDSLPKNAKVSGAFCSTWFNGKSAFVLQSFQENIESVSTLAHELGHAVHAYLSSENQKFLSQSSPMVLAETASEFGRMLFIEDYLKNSNDSKEKKVILFQSVEDLMIIIFEVGSRFRFEESLYDAISKGEYLSPSKINELYWKAREKYFGSAIKWHSEQAYHWAWKPHYYGSGLRFYNYPYVFAEMIVLGLFNKYKQEGTSFVPKYKNLLASGGSKSPLELTREIGIDLDSEEFWKNGLTEVERLFNELKMFD
jgi:oligoendopeptidase F